MKKKLLTLISTIVVAGAFAQQRAPSAPATGTAEKPAKTEMKDAPAFNWEQTSVDIVLQAYGEQVGKTVLKDPGTPNATITLKSREGQKLTKPEYLEAIEVVLEMYGIHLEPYGENFVRAIPRAKARKIVGMAVYMSMEDVPEDTKDGTVVSVRLEFEHIGTEEAQKALEGFKSDSGLLQIFERANSILVTDTWENIKRMNEIRLMLDKKTPVAEEMFTRQIKYASAQDIKTALEAIVQESQKELEKNKSANNTKATPATTPTGFRPFGLNKTQQPQQSNPVNESQLTNISDADRGMIRGKVLILADERSNKLVIITQKANMDAFDKVIEQLDVETTPDTVVKVYRLKYADAEEVSDMINDLIGNAASSKSSSKGNQNANAKKGQGTNMTKNNAGKNKSVNQRSGDAKAGELSKENTTVLADKRINGLVVMTDKDLVPVLEQIIESMDVKLAQVLIETVIIEVSLGDEISTGIDWVNNNWTGNDPTARGGGGGGVNGDKLSTLLGTSSSKTYSEWASEAKSVLQGSSSTYSGTQNLTTEEIDKYIKSALEFAKSSSSMTPSGAGITYFLKSDKLNLSAIITASKSDSHSKYLASPVVMTVDNKEATIDATELKYLFKGYQYSGSSYNGSPVPDYEQKEIGIKIKVTPKINPNGTVMLNVEEEYSQEGAGQTIEGSTSSGTTKFNAATTVTRKMSADVLLDNMQTVVLGGLTQTTTAESTTGIPYLKDIPLIGKWLFGTVTQTEGRNELLVFMTPYVLTDAEAAQVEASRRKRALSAQGAWDDHGWSSSELADPVSVKEQLRRQKAEWKKLDEEHDASRELEKSRQDRVKKLIERMQEESEQDERQKAMEKSE